MITEEQVGKAASRYRRWKSGDCSNPYKSPYFNCDGDDPAYIDRDRRTLADAYIDELSRRDAEQAERAKPIDAEWCLANGAAWNNHRAVAWWRILDNSRLEFNSVNGVALIIGDGWAYFDDITTRGQLVDLLAALKGGGE